MNKRCRTGILGGTFDPIHRGHIMMGEAASKACGLDRLLFMPCSIPAHKPADKPVSPYHRFAMTALAVKDRPRFYADPMEVERPSTTYTVDTLRSMVRTNGDDFFFIMGMDSLLQIGEWKEPEEILNLSGLIVLNRPGFEPDGSKIPGPFRDRISRPPVKEDGMNRVYIVEMTPCDVSSTEIRRKLAENGDDGGGLHPEVMEYIEKYNLYRSNDER